MIWASMLFTVYNQCTQYQYTTFTTTGLVSLRQFIILNDLGFDAVYSV